MSEQAPERNRYDDDSPESVVVRYGASLDSMESAGRDKFDAVYTRSIVKIDDLVRSLTGSGGIEFADLYTRVMPPPFDESGYDERQWCDYLRTTPALLMRDGVPDADKLTPEYINGVIFAALSIKERCHGPECMSYHDAVNGLQCFQSEMCPAKVVNHIFVQTSADLSIRRIMFGDQEGPEGEHTLRLVRAMRESLIAYELTTKEIFNAQLDGAFSSDMELLHQATAS